MSDHNCLYFECSCCNYVDFFLIFPIDDSTDGDFTPTVEMLIHEFDDEATLDEEEEIEPIDSQLLELQDLQRVCNKLRLTR